MEELQLTKELYFKILDYAIARGYSANTIKVYSCYLKKIMKKYKVLNRDILPKILKKIKHQNQRAVLVLINNYCYHSKIDFNIIIPRIRKHPRALPKILSIEEIKVMVEAAPKPYDLFLRCVYNIGAGLRISEAIKLSWEHINWIDWLRGGRKYGVAIIKDAKGGKDRITRIPNKLMEDLYSRAKELQILNEFGVPQGGMIWMFNLADFKPSLLSTNRKKWKEEALKRAYDWFRYNILKKHCEKALGRRINIHQFRHRRATYLYEEEKIPIERIKDLLGHSDIENTLIYTKVSQKETFDMIQDKEII